jgi:hypothetical protein
LTRRLGTAVRDVLSFGQQGPAGRDERGRERSEQLIERGSAVGLAGHERAVDGGEGEARVGR